MFKIILLFFLIPSAFAGNKIIEIGYGSGKVESQSVTSRFIQFSYEPEQSLTSFLGGDLGYAFGLRTSNYTSDLFQASDIKTEFLKDIDVTSHNIFAQIHFKRDIYQFGFNLDVLGISSSSSSQINGSNQSVENETTNLFLFASNDKGTLNSQFFFAVTLEPVIIRAGLSHSLITFKDTGLTGDNDRQRFFDLAFLSIGYVF